MKILIIWFWLLIFLTVNGQHAVFGANTKQSSETKEKKVAEAKKQKEIWKRDMERDLKTKPKPLSRDRTVHRYVTKEQAKIDAKKGIAPGSHLAATGGPGRPLSQTKAKHRYGLKETPKIRQDVELKKGDKVRLNRVIGGEKGRGEIKTTQREKVTKSIDLK
ncbi:MAG: hypothetical protein Q7J56_02095 [Deltaproteobacteria bacterium]|nr:hypothetical protein [Deltaproteobacteria bacterium]